MGGFINQLTAPVGLKLFSGGPYADAGALDKAQQSNEQQMALAKEYLAKIAPLIAEIAGSAGVTNPMTGEAGQFSSDLYGLSPLQQAEVNKQASIDSQAYDNILSKVRANLSSRGMMNSSTMAAAEAYLKRQMVGQIGSERIQAGQNAYNTRTSAIDQIAGLLGGAYGQQQNVLGQRQNIFAQQGQLAEQAQKDAFARLGQALGLGLYMGGVPPFGGGGLPGQRKQDQQKAPWDEQWGNFYQGTGEQPPITLGQGGGGGGYLSNINWNSIYR